MFVSSSVHFFLARTFFLLAFAFEVTFFSSTNGQADLNQQAGLVANYFGGSAGFGGFAIYAYELSYLGGTLKEWPSVNTGFPVVPHLPLRR